MSIRFMTDGQTLNHEPDSSNHSMISASLTTLRPNINPTINRRRPNTALIAATSMTPIPEDETLGDSSTISPTNMTSTVTRGEEDVPLIALIDIE